MSDRYSKVKDHPNLARDESTRALINTDHDGYRAFRERRAKQKQQERRVRNLEERMNRMEGLLEQILDNVKG